MTDESFAEYLFGGIKDGTDSPIRRRFEITFVIRAHGGISIGFTRHGSVETGPARRLRELTGEEVLEFDEIEPEQFYYAKAEWTGDWYSYEFSVVKSGDPHNPTEIERSGLDVIDSGSIGASETELSEVLDGLSVSMDEELDELSDVVGESGVEIDFVDGDYSSEAAKRLARVVDESDGTSSRSHTFTDDRSSATARTSMSSEGPLADEATFSSATLDIDEDRAEKVLTVIADAVERRERSGFDVEMIVIGLPQYKVLFPYAKAKFDCRPKNLLGGRMEMIVVPGPMIHPVVENRVLLDEEMFD